MELTKKYGFTVCLLLISNVLQGDSWYLIKVSCKVSHLGWKETGGGPLCHWIMNMLILCTLSSCTQSIVHILFLYITAMTVNDWFLSIPGHIFVTDTETRDDIHEYFNVELNKGSWSRSHFSSVLFSRKEMYLSNDTLLKVKSSLLIKRLARIPCQPF